MRERDLASFSEECLTGRETDCNENDGAVASVAIFVLRLLLLLMSCTHHEVEVSFARLKPQGFACNSLCTCVFDPAAAWSRAVSHVAFPPHAPLAASERGASMARSHNLPQKLQLSKSGTCAEQDTEGIIDVSGASAGMALP